MAMKPQILILFLLPLLFKGEAVCANTLNEAVKEARKQGQVLSAKTRQGVHEIRVVTPQGSVKTIRKPATVQKQPPPSLNSRDYFAQPKPDSSRSDRQQPDNRREIQHSRRPEFRRFQRHSQPTASPRNRRPAQRPAQRPTQRPVPQPRTQVRPQPSNDRDPD